MTDLTFAHLIVKRVLMRDTHNNEKRADELASAILSHLKDSGFSINYETTDVNTEYVNDRSRS